MTPKDHDWKKDSSSLEGDDADAETLKKTKKVPSNVEALKKVQSFPLNCHQPPQMFGQELHSPLNISIQQSDSPLNPTLDKRQQLPPHMPCHVGTSHNSSIKVAQIGTQNEEESSLPDTKQFGFNDRRQTTTAREKSPPIEGKSQTIIDEKTQMTNDPQKKNVTQAHSKDISQPLTTEDISNQIKDGDQKQLETQHDRAHFYENSHTNSKNVVLTETNNLPLALQEYLETAAENFDQTLPTQEETNKIIKDTNMSLEEIDKWFLLNYIKSKGGNIAMEDVSYIRGWLRNQNKRLVLTKEEEKTISEATGLSQYWLQELFLLRVNDEKVEEMYVVDSNKSVQQQQQQQQHQKQSVGINSLARSISNKTSTDNTALTEEAMSISCSKSVSKPCYLYSTAKGRQAKVKVTPAYAENEIYLMDWVQSHDGNLLPSKEMKQQISTETGLSVVSIGRWFGEQIRREETSRRIITHTTKSSSEVDDDAMTIHEYLEDWVVTHAEHPYPTLRHMQMMERVTGLSDERIRHWFSKKPRTRRKNDKQIVQKSTVKSAPPVDSDDDSDAMHGADFNCDDTDSSADSDSNDEADSIDEKTSNEIAKPFFDESSAENPNTKMSGDRMEASRGPSAPSMDDFSDDIVQHVLSFVSWVSLEHLVAFGLTSKRSHRLLHSSVHSEMLFKSAYINKFRLGAGNFERVCSTWKERWKNMYNIRSGLKAHFLLEEYGGGRMKNDTNELSKYPLRETAGLLTTNEELHSILYDNPSHVPPGEFHYSIGYFGMEPIPTLTYIVEDGDKISAPQQPVMIWGDFDGVRIFDSLDELIINSKDYDNTDESHNNSHPIQGNDDSISNEKDCDSSSKATDAKIVIAERANFSAFEKKPYAHIKRLSIERKNKKRPRYCAVGNTDGGGQVLTVLTCSAIISEGSKYAEGGGCLVEKGPCFFLGFASGMVMAVSAVDDSDGWFKFEKTSAATLHTDEVTALTLLPATNSSTCPMLASGSVDGKVYLYPHALDRGKCFSLDYSVLAFANRDHAPIFSMSAIKLIDAGENEKVVVCTGDQQGNLSLWSTTCSRSLIPSPYQSNGDSEQESSMWDADNNISGVSVPETNGFEFQFDHFRRSPSKRAHRDVIITQLQFTYTNTLIAGNNIGDVCVWDLSMESNGDTKNNVEESSSILNLEQNEDVKPRINLRYNISSAHSGTIEWMKICGNMVLTSGGNDGQIKGWDLKSGELLGSVTCHAGKMYPPVPDTIPDENEHTCKGRKPKIFQLRSAVVGSLPHPDKPYLVSLCRDGTLNYWNFGLSVRQNVEELGGNARNGRFLIPKTPKNKGDAPKNAEALKSVMIDNHKGGFSADLRERMKLCIIQSAINLSKSPDIKNTTFIGADGILYDNLKGAFTKYSGMKACQECKNSAQGAFICRVKRRHCYPDFDQGKNSWTILQYLVRKGLISFDGKIPDNYDPSSQPEKSVLSSDEKSLEEVTLTETNKANMLSSDEQSIESMASTEKNHESMVSADEQRKTSIEFAIDNTESSWACSLCTFINDNKVERCQVCSAWRPSSSQNHTLSLGPVSKPLKTLQVASKPVSTWVCDYCSNENELRRTKCRSCLKRKHQKGCEEHGFDDSDSQLIVKSQPLKKMWKCFNCEHYNGIHRYICEYCSSRSGGEIVLAPPTILPDKEATESSPNDFKTHTVWQCHSCDYYNSLSQRKCNGCGEKGGSSVVLISSIPHWICNHCHYKNAESFKTCDSCHRSRDDQGIPSETGRYTSKSHEKITKNDSKSHSLETDKEAKKQRNDTEDISVKNIPEETKNITCNQKNSGGTKVGLWFDKSRNSFSLWECFRCYEKNPTILDNCQECNAPKSCRRKRKLPEVESIADVSSHQSAETENACSEGVKVIRPSWKCKTCSRRNPGSTNTCSKCCTPQNAPSGQKKREELSIAKDNGAKSERPIRKRLARSTSYSKDTISSRGSITLANGTDTTTLGKNAGSNSSSKTAISGAESITLAKTSDDPKNEGSAYSGDWQCSKCTYINNCKSFSCEICNYRKKSRRRR